MESEAQTVPVRIYQAENQIMLAAPMPGLEAQDISVSISDKRVTIMGQERGPGQHNVNWRSASGL
jgi:HSP20 family molecular chaperone IbpA